MSKFKEAFAKARKGGAKEFDYGGKKYNTKLKAEGGSKKPSSLPKKAPVPTSRASAVSSMSKKPSFSSLTEAGKKPSKPTASAAKPFMRDTSTLNAFKQKEARRSSDESIGKKNAPNVKKGIGKFMLGKGYKG